MSAGSGEGARRTGPALEAMYGFALWLIPTVELVVKGGVASNTVAKSSDSRPAIVTRPRAMVV